MIKAGYIQNFSICGISPSSSFLDFIPETNLFTDPFYS